MKTRLLIVFLFLLPVLTLSAQDDTPPTYQLRTPTLEAYLQLLADTSACSNPVHPSGFWNFCEVLLGELSAYEDEFQHQPFDLLLSAYDATDEYLADSIGRGTYVERTTWLNSLVLAWFNSHLPERNVASPQQFADFTLEIIPRDFNGDEQDEYLVKVDSFLLSGYVIIAWSEDTHQFTLIPSPLPASVPYATYQYEESGELQDLYFGDTNGDGIPEWLVAFGGWGSGGFTYGQLMLLAWRDGELVNIANQPMSYRDGAGGGILIVTSNVNWEFINLDDDAALEFQFIVQPLDNWGCHQRDILVFDWRDDENDYFSQGQEFDIPATMECAIRQAEEEMWASNFTAAAMLYSNALTLSIDNVNYMDETRQYAQIRLAQAYVMSGQQQVARPLIEQLSTQTPYSGLNEAFIWILQTFSLDSPDLSCAAFYNLVRQTSLSAFDHEDFNDALSSHFNVGIDYEFSGSVMGGNSGTPDPAKAGCDAPRRIARQLEDPIYSTQNPLEQLENHGIVIRESISDDINGDGINDWLIWNEANVLPILLISNPDSSLYSMSRPNFWDIDTRIDLHSLIPAEPVPASTPAENPNDMDPAELVNRLDDSIDDYFFYVRNLFLSLENVDEGLQLLAHVISANYLADYPNARSAIRYWRTTILMADDRNDEALAEYVAIYETAPESAWGQLAALHLEPTE